MGITSLLPSPNQAIAVPAATDWIAVSKIIVLELGFVGTLAAILTGHASPDVVSLAWALGGTLGVLRLADVAANVVNVKSFLSKPGSGVVPQAVGTALIRTNTTETGGSPDASTGTP